MPSKEWLDGYYDAVRNTSDSVYWDSINFDLLNESLLRELFIYYKSDAHRYFRKIQHLITPDFLREIKDLF